MSNKLLIFNRVVKKRDEEWGEEDSDPFLAIAELMTDLQNRIEKLEKEGKRLNEEIISLRSEPKIKDKTIRRVRHIRDLKTHQIISSIISEEEESDG